MWDWSSCSSMDSNAYSCMELWNERIVDVGTRFTMTDYTSSLKIDLFASNEKACCANVAIVT